MTDRRSEVCCLLDSPIGPLGLFASAAGLTRLRFGAVEEASGSSPHLEAGRRWLEAYFERSPMETLPPLDPEGTPWQRLVWGLVAAIPFGVTRSYGSLAVELDKPGGSRAVGMANNKNPLPIFVPCHRVVGADGKLVGYAGGLDVKRRLLELEQGPGPLFS